MCRLCVLWMLSERVRVLKDEMSMRCDILHLWIVYFFNSGARYCCKQHV